MDGGSRNRPDRLCLRDRPPRGDRQPEARRAHHDESASFISQVHPSVAGSIVAGAILVVIGSSGIAACVLLATVGGPAGQRALATINRFMVDHADVLVAALVVLIGIKIVGDGISGLARG